MFKIYGAKTEDGKWYIGCTSQPLKKRIQGHKCDAKYNHTNMKFHRAVRENGFSSIQWPILQDEIATLEEAEVLERHYISVHNSIEHGHNDNRGGVGFDGTNLAARLKVADTLKNVYHSDPSTRLKHSRERGGFEGFVFKPTGEFVGQYHTQIEACEDLKLPKSKVCLALKGERKTVGGYVVRSSYDPPERLKTLGSKYFPIQVYLNGKEYGTWDSIRKFCKHAHLATQTVRKIIRGEIQSQYEIKRSS